ncbi:ATP-binding cassette sub-family C member 2-like isoform X2 [Amblyomma americanum]
MEYSAQPSEVASQLLKGAVLLVLVLFHKQQTVQGNYTKFPRGPFLTLLDAAQVVLLVTSTVLALSTGCRTLKPALSIDSLDAWTLRSATADFAMAFSLVLMAALLAKRWIRCLPPSGFVCTLLGGLATATVLDAVHFCAPAHSLPTSLMQPELRSKQSLVVRFVLATVMLGSFLDSGLRDLVLFRPNITKRSKDEDCSSVFARIACVSVYSQCRDAMRREKLAKISFPVVRRGMRCKRLLERLVTRKSFRNIHSRRPRSFLFGVMDVLWIDALRLVLCTMAYFSCLFARIPALEYIVTSCGTAYMPTASLLFIVTSLGEFLLSVYTLEISHVFGCRVRSLILSIIFKKVSGMTSRTRSLYPAGRILSMLGVDCLQLCNLIFVASVPLVGFVTLPFVLWMLAARVGAVPALCCAAWMVLVLSLLFIVAPVQQRIWIRAQAAREERLKATSDLLSTIRVVKMYAWEDALQESVLRARLVEQKWLLRVNLLDAVLDSVYSSTSSVLMIILFAALNFLEPQVALSPALSFTCVALISMTDLTMSGCGQLLRVLNQALVALKRIAGFCNAKEMEEELENKKSSHVNRNGTVKMTKCSFSWNHESKTTTEAQLQDITLDIEPGSLVGIVGFVGSGKSSLLSAILGDMERVKGAATCTGRIAFMPQLANVHNMTIRDNILFGKPMNTPLYHRVISSCQLTSDLNKLQSGDMTEAGEKGSNLSGGQKQRISIARAVYSQSDVYLLDDPLSALDPVVAARLFKEVIGNDGLLKNKTRIMVCNQANYLCHMDKLVLVHDRRIQTYKNFVDLIQDPQAPKNLSDCLQHNPSEDSSSVRMRDNLEDNDTVGRVTVDEIGESKKTSWQLLCALLRLGGWQGPLAVAAFCVAACALGWEQVWIKQWTDAAVTPQAAHASWVQGLLGLCVLDVCFRILGAVLLGFTARELSGNVHSQMLSGVLRSAVSFFDATPRGRILNRFTTDMDLMDARIFLAGKQTVQNSLLTLAKVAVIATQSPVVVAATAVVIILGGFGLNLTMKVSHRATFGDSLAMSRVMQLVTETVQALSSLRAYGMLAQFREHYYRLTDETISAYSLFIICYRFTRAIASSAAFVVVLTTLVANTMFAGDGGPNPSSLGLALSAACSVPLGLMTLGVMVFGVLQMIVAFERCLEYTELIPEKDVGDAWTEEKKAAVQKYLANWPTEGKVEFQNYSASYRPGVLPNVLIDITFTVKPQEKIGVVGRTGAGKSSIVLALLRMLDASQGRILIDGVDIREVPLPKLRRSITVIPQDPSLVRGTLRVNLDPGNTYSDEKIWWTLEKVHLASIVSEHPRRLLLETHDGGSNLSVGQRQLVCLARALLRDTRILLLDEATSQMDGDTDRLIQATLRDAFAQCTLFTIAHRINTVLDYDRILVLEDGRVRELDSPTQLLSDPSTSFHAMALDAGILNVPDGQPNTKTYL